MSNRLLQILASLAQRRALRTLDTICETQHQISTRKLGQYLEPIGDELAGHAFHLRIEYDALTSKVAELEAELAKLRTELGDGTTGNKYRAELYDEVWQKARDMGYGNVTMALDELAKLRAGQEPVATRQYYYRVDGCKAVGAWDSDCICWHDEGTGPNPTADIEVEWRDKPAPQPSAVPDGWLSATDPEATPEQNTIYQVSGLRAGQALNSICRMLGGRWPDAKLEQEAPIAHRFFMELIGAVAPSAPATVQGVNQQLLEALEAMLEECDPMKLNCGEPWCRARAAIAAARQEGGKV